MTYSLTNKMICYGDSQTAGFTWGTTIQSTSPFIDQAVGRGVTGNASGTVAIRQGGIVLTTDAAVTTTGTTAVTVAVKASHTPCNINTNFSLMDLSVGGVRGVGSIVDDARFDEVAGTYTMSFTPSASVSPAVTVPAGTACEALDVLDNPNWGTFLHVFWAGGNDAAKSAATAVEGTVVAMHAMVDRLKQHVSKPLFLVAGCTVANTDVAGTQRHDIALAQRNALLQEFPDNAINIWEHVRDNGLTILGIEPTEADLAAIEGQSMPRSLTSDGIHYTVANRRDVVAPFVLSNLESRNWLNLGGIFMPEYNKTTWKNSPSTDTPLSAANLNKIEDGLESAHAAIDTTASAINAAVADKVTKPTATKNSVITVNSSGVVSAMSYGEGSSDGIVYRGMGNRANIGEPQTDLNITNKKYVDDAISDAVSAATEPLIARIEALESAAE